MAYLIEISLHLAPKYNIHLDPMPHGLREYPELRSGDAVSADLLPKRARLRTARRFIPRIGLLAGYWAVGQDFKDLVEEREPGVHQFFPIQIFYKDGRAVEEAFYILHIRRSISALKLEQSNAALQSSGIVQILFHPLKIVLDRAKISGRHLWREEWYTYISDDLFAALLKKGLLRGLLYYKAEEE